MTNEPVIEISGVSKAFKLRIQRPYVITDIYHRLFGRGRKDEDFWAVKDISLSIAKGESVALVGRNGAGKSTLLSMIAGALWPTSGDIIVRGRLGALLELGAGFHPDLTGRENIYLNASLLGLSRDEIEAQIQNIIDFSELQEFIDVPLRNYSSGMQVRLGFSVAAHTDPDILIMDEALAVGDSAFQQKCIARIQEFKAAGKTFLFVSHNPTQVSSLCTRIIWLEQGRLRADGPTAEIGAAYKAALEEQKAAKARAK